MARLTSSASVTGACSPTSSTVTEAVPLPAWNAPGVHLPAQAAAIRRRRAIRPASADAATGTSAGQSWPGSFSHSTTRVEGAGPGASSGPAGRPG